MGMHIEEEEKTGRKAALQKLMEVMSHHSGKSLLGRKGKPVAASIEVEGPGAMADDGDGDEKGFCPHCGSAKG